MYAAALYVETDTARAELKRLQKEGFFSQGYTDDRIMEGLILGKFRKVMQIQMLRSASESQVPFLLRGSYQDLCSPSAMWNKSRQRLPKEIRLQISCWPALHTTPGSSASGVHTTMCPREEASPGVFAPAQRTPGTMHQQRS